MSKQAKERRIKLEERRATQREMIEELKNNEPPRPGRMCEAEVRELKAKLNQAYSLLASAGDQLVTMVDCINEEMGDNPVYGLIAEIDAFLPATEGHKE